MGGCVLYGQTLKRRCCSVTRKPRTRLAHLGRNPARDQGLVNTPVGRASTVVFPTLAELRAATARPQEGVFYGRFGTHNRHDLEAAVADLDGADGAVAVPSGLAACVLAILSQVRNGDDVLVSDNVYWPTRKSCDDLLQRLGVTVRYFDPAIGGDIAQLIRANTRLIYLESPGSVTFEVSDVPAICRAAQAAGCVTALDNTWATSLGFDAIGHGVDLVVHAATKYLVGPSDAMLGVVSGSGAALQRVRDGAMQLGHSVSPDDCALALRGLRTLAVRLDQHTRSALRVCEWLSEQPEVQDILFPPWPADAGHALWSRDFAGGCGLMAIRLPALDEQQLAGFVDGFELFALGYSWGGYESLILPTDPRPLRSASPWTQPGQLIRLHIGLEAVEDLLEDLAAGFQRLRLVL